MRRAPLEEVRSPIMMAYTIKNKRSYDNALANYVIDRFPATDVRPYALIQARPKTAFGG